MELVVLAGGLGSRYGGLKQFEPVDDHNNFILDYLVFDAIKLGASKVIFVISPHSFSYFKNTVANKLSSHIKVDFAFQTNSQIPFPYYIPINRKKPLGTAHALLCAKPKISQNFVVVNADDFYGYDALKCAFSFDKNLNQKTAGIVVYPAKNTLSLHGEVKRGVCEMSGSKITNIVETKIQRSGNHLLSLSPASGTISYLKSIKNDIFVSMNLLALSPEILDLFEEEFLLFFKTHKHCLDTAEFFLPSVLTNLSNKKFISLVSIKTNSIWKGLTFQDDLNEVKNHIKSLKIENKYPENLWE